MAGSTRLDKPRFGTGSCSRLVVAALFGWTTTLYPALAETAKPDEKAAQVEPKPLPPPPPAPPADRAATRYSISDLEYLLGPIALYPDPLLSLILSASTEPDQLIEAEHWLANNKKAVAANDFTGAEALRLEPSVEALLRFPDVVQMLNDHIEWTETIGSAFATQPDDIAAVIQLLRAQAEAVGNLKSTPEQTVTVERQPGGERTIVIAPANPERVYVPVYDSSTVFDTAATSALVFGTAILVGSTWNNRWGWNNRGWNNVWVTHHWQGAPGWRPGRPGHRPPPPGVWRPDRPGSNRPERPGVRPERPGNRPGVRPERPNRPERPGTLPERPNVRPERPGNRPERPNARPERPNVRPERPGNRPERPSARPERPNARPERPGNRPERPNARPNRPEAGNRPNANRPAARPERPQGARPGQNRPARNARPQNRPQQGARPQNRPQQARPQNRPQQARPRPQQARPQQQRARQQQNRSRQPQRGRNCRPGTNCR